MKFYAQTLLLKDDPEKIAAYKKYHAQPWPEVMQALRTVGVVDMKIFLIGRTLFMYMTASDDFDFERDMPRYLEQDPKCQEWEDLMSEFQEPVPEAKEGEKWTMMETVFDIALH